MIRDNHHIEVILRPPKTCKKSLGETIRTWLIIYLYSAQLRGSHAFSILFHSPFGLPGCHYVAVALWLRASNIFHNCVRHDLSGAGSSPAGSVGRGLNLQKLNYQYLTTSVAVVLVVR